MQVARDALPVQIVLTVGFLVRAFADIADIAVFVDIGHKRQPSLASGIVRPASGSQTRFQGTNTAAPSNRPARRSARAWLAC